MAKIKIVAFSDTHGFHRQVKIPECDLLIFAGDIGLEHTSRVPVLYDFVDFLDSAPAKKKVVILGNHDRLGESEMASLIKEAFTEKGIFLLCNEGIRLFDQTIWASPYTPEFCNWAFSFKRGAEAKKHWNQIPDNIDILVTHGPPFNILDTTLWDGPDKHFGDRELLDRILLGVRPKLHIFGHFHFSGGRQARIAGTSHNKIKTLFANVSICDEYYNPVNPVMEFYI